MTDLFDALRDAVPEAAPVHRGAIWAEWVEIRLRRSILLLERGREALQNEEPALAVEHMTGSSTMAPDFAEAYMTWGPRHISSRGLYGPSWMDIRMAFPSIRGISSGDIPASGLILEELGYTEEPSRRGAPPSPSIRIRSARRRAIDRLGARRRRHATLGPGSP